MTPAPMTASFFGTDVDIERADVVADDLVIDRNAGEVARFRTGGDDDLFRLDEFAAHPDLPAFTARVAGAADERPVPVEQGDLVLLEQSLDAAGQLFDDAVLAADHPGDIDRRLADANPLFGKTVSGFLEEVRGMQQRFDGMQPTLRQVPPRRGSPLGSA
jgi:hypothetical protein